MQAEPILAHKSPSQLRKHFVLLEYLQNGFNKTKAYMTVYSGSSYDTARANSCVLFKELGLKEELQLQLEKKGLTKQEDLLLKLNKIIDGEKTRDSDKIGAIKLAAQLQGMLTEKREITERRSQPEINPEELKELQDKADRIMYPDATKLKKEVEELREDNAKLEREKEALEKLLTPIES